MLRIHSSMSDNCSIELTEKDSKEKSADEKDGENEKESKEKSEKEGKDKEDKFFEPHYYSKLLAYLYSSRLRNTIHIANEQYICSFSIELDSPPPEFYL